MSTPGNKILEATFVNGILTARPTADLQLDAAPRFRLELLKLVEEHKPTGVMLDFANVTFMGSASLGVLVEVLRHLGKTATLELVNVNNNIRTVLEITRLTALFPVRGPNG